LIGKFAALMIAEYICAHKYDFAWCDALAGNLLMVLGSHLVNWR
jgi:hypothetical protein